jgi:hypothetical protein
VTPQEKSATQAETLRIALDFLDEIAGAKIDIPEFPNGGLWIHTPDQVRTWLRYLENLAINDGPLEGGAA